MLHLGIVNHCISCQNVSFKVSLSRCLDLNDASASQDSNSASATSNSATAGPSTTGNIDDNARPYTIVDLIPRNPYNWKHIRIRDLPNNNNKNSNRNVSITIDHYYEIDETNITNLIINEDNKS